MERIEQGIGRGGLVEAADHPFDDVIDVGEIPLHVALVEHLDRLAGQDRASEQHRRHVRPTPGAIHGEEAQARGRQAVEMAVGVSHQLVGLLGGRIQAHRMVHRVLLREGHLAVTAVHRAAGGIHQVGNTLMAAGLQHGPESHQVALDVNSRILDRVAHARLGREVDHPVGLLLGHQGRQAPAIGHIQLGEAKLPGRRGGLQQRQAGPLEGGIVIGVEVVHTHHPLAAGQQAQRNRGTDEARRAGDQNGSGHQARASRSRK